MFAELELWRTEALQRSARLSLNADSINEAVAVMTNCFGSDWLSSACRRDQSGLWFRMHPIGHLITPPGDNQITELLELVEYIKAAAASPVFSQLIQGLKAQYGPTFLQLAAGYRLKRLGAQDLIFEPPVQRGLRGDLAFLLEGLPVIAECYIPRVRQASLEVHWLLQRCLTLREGAHPAIVSIAIKLKSSLNAVERKTIVRIVRELCGEIDEQASSEITKSSPSTRFAETTAACISVARTREARPGEYSHGLQDSRFPDMSREPPFVFARLATAFASEMKPGREMPERETRDHVAIWLSDAEARQQDLKQSLDEPIATLSRKLERKLTQTKVDEHTGRLLIVSSWIGRELSRASNGAIEALRDSLFRKHSNVMGVLFAMHSYRSDIKRPFYQFRAVLAEPSRVIGPVHLTLLKELEEAHPTPPVIR
jgi:hypothetical protein